MISSCPLCSNTGTTFLKNENHHFYQCSVCKGIYRDPKEFLHRSAEKKRYKHHKNNLEDHGYIQFADPIISYIKNNCETNYKGLDFGAGHTPVISEILKKEGYQIEIYDPIFFNNPKILNNTYDFISSCEVIEHFYHPKKEFKLLSGLLRPDGKLIIMTYIYDKSINFEKWFYKNDPTHVFIYQKETLEWIKNHFNFSGIIIDRRLIVFTR